MTSSGLVPPWKLAPQNTYILRNANIVNPIDGSVLEGATVRLSEGTIQSVTTTRAIKLEEPPQGSEITVDLEGKYVCPGLIDAHVHIAAVPGEKDLRDTLGLAEQISYLRQPYVCLQMIRRGFTTVRDCGGATLALKEAIEEGVIVGPRLFIAGRLLTQTGGSADSRGPHDHSECCGGPEYLGRVCDGIPECIKGAREAIRTGSDFIKIMTGGSITGLSEKITSVQFSAEEIQAITTVAKDSGTYVTAHAYTPAAIRHALDNGVMGIEHGNLLDAEVAKYMAEKGAFLTPTLTTYAMAASPDFEGFMSHPSMEAKLKEVLGAGQRSLKIASDAGVHICFGTDLLGPMVVAQTKEFALRAHVLSPVVILQSATVTAARLLGQADFLGQIKSGFAADLLILNKNPLENIGIFDEPEKHLLGVFKDGRVQTSRWSKLREDIVAPVSIIQ
ncbi:Metallo-dependent hydrolase [Venustampulla echinocandica]|uniref:Metallo-dependent hydrolase n=1 Tax=Venustampulla echinocandica TaxID=2656787 RepID=A0A370TMZ5_9HELO|nr:Metallo-dependent hydrolase [Venustampulla echinocandica]RDL36884.1 Metallo-dependent hydrolase [Venustampulla echinocandica]